jgi:hypothetical protein
LTPTDLPKELHLCGVVEPLGDEHHVEHLRKHSLRLGKLSVQMYLFKKSLGTVVGPPRL